MSGARLYANPWLAWRMNVSLFVVISAFFFGCFEAWRAATTDAEDQFGYLFALFFIGGSIYGARLILTGHTDTVLSLHVARPGDEATVVLWRPFSKRRVVGPLGNLVEWRPYAKQVRPNVRVPIVLADHPDYPRPLEFELGQGITMSDEFRALAGEAIASAGGVQRAD